MQRTSERLRKARFSSLRFVVIRWLCAEANYFR